MIDEEVRAFVDTGYEKAETILSDHLDDLHNLAQSLLEYETLTGDEIHALLRGEEIGRGPHDEPEDQRKKKPATVPSAGRKKRRPSGGTGAPEPQGT
ncbi:MAG: cell division protein FtsH, partial [Alphaproteobacteria bacterium]|nr:cell division protein FtsH [Alphaproteobacteria bacterium]